MMERSRTSAPLVRHVFAGVTSILGASLVLGAVVLLNRFSDALEEKNVTQGTSIEVRKTAKPKRQVKKEKPKPKSKPRSPPPPSLAALTSGIGNFAIELPGFDMNDVGSSTEDLLGGDSEVTHTSDTVDDPPKVMATGGELSYPLSARQNGITGFVLIGVLVSPSGGVKNLRVLESEPPGTFDQYATEFVQRWQFQPGRYKGEAVSVWVEQKVTFNLDS